MTNDPTPTLPEPLPNSPELVGVSESSGEAPPNIRPESERNPSGPECPECNDVPSPDGLACGNCGLYGTPTEDELNESFTMPVELPYTPPRPDCCPGFSVRVDVIPDPQYGLEFPTYEATYTHRRTCDVWRYL